jgi:hypothetical protein
VCVDERTDTEAVLSSTRNSSAPTASAVDNIDAPDEVQDDSIDRGDKPGTP